MFRRFIHFILWFSAFGIGLLGYAVLIEPSRLVVRKVDFISDKYSGPDMRIALITDIHINSLHVPPNRVLDIVAKINAQHPAVVLIPGDFIAGHDKIQYRSERFNAGIEKGMSHLKQLSAPTYATIGNHDAWWSAARATAHLEDAGVTVLENQAVNLDGFCLVGLADDLTSSPSRSAYEGCAENAPPLVFTHSPDAWRTFRSDSVLALAGHTHGGQINLPLIGRRVNAVSLGPEYSYGFSKIGGVDMFVSAGVGTSILPIRFRAPPEIVILTVQAQN